MIFNLHLFATNSKGLQGVSLYKVLKTLGLEEAGIFTYGWEEQEHSFGSENHAIKSKITVSSDFAMFSPLAKYFADTHTIELRVDIENFKSQEFEISSSGTFVNFIDSALTEHRLIELFKVAHEVRFSGRQDNLKAIRNSKADI